MMRIGQGFDVHKFTMRRPCVLGGITVAEDFGLEGHSDADVLIHALIDALLGALSLGDIGSWFPDNDPRYKDISSVKLLSLVWTEVVKRGYQLINLDLTILAEKPRVGPYRRQIQDNLASVLHVNAEQVSIKATTTEKMGFVGREEGIAAFAVVLLEKAEELHYQKSSHSVAQLPPQTLAYVGDAVYEVHVRRHLVDLGLTRGSDLQKQAKIFVSAKAQARRLQGILAMLTPEEMVILKRGRNSKKGIVPKNTDVLVYRYSTGIEALLGYLYLTGAEKRLQEIITALINYKGEDGSND